MDPNTHEREVEELDENQLPTEDETSPEATGPDPLLSPASQIGRAAQTGGTPEAGAQPGEEARQGWKMPDESDTPPEWPQPTTDG
jgi:hypothetical protein